MKKVLFATCLLYSISLFAQDFWTEFSTAQPYTPTGVKSISIVNNNITWLKMSNGNQVWQSMRRYAKTTNGGMKNIAVLLLLTLSLTG